MLAEEINCGVNYVMAGLSSHLGISSGRNLQLKVKSIFITHSGTSVSSSRKEEGLVGFKKEMSSALHQMLREIVKNSGVFTNPPTKYKGFHFTHLGSRLTLLVSLLQENPFTIKTKQNKTKKQFGSVTENM